MADVTDANSKDVELCDQCHRSGVVLLRSMAKWSPFDWFRCVGCGHIFTRARLPKPTMPTTPRPEGIAD